MVKQSFSSLGSNTSSKLYEHDNIDDFLINPAEVTRVDPMQTASMYHGSKLSSKQKMPPWMAWCWQ